MGDKSPKSKDRQKKQAVVQKTTEKAAAFTKAHPASAVELGKKKR